MGKKLKTLHYITTIAEPELDIINVTGMTCVGVPMGSPEFVTAFVRSKAKIIEMCKSSASSLTQ
jgi:hypothetical protein